MGASLLGKSMEQKHNITEFWRAAEQGDLQTVRQFVEVGVDIHSRFEYALRTALQNGYLDMVDFLVAKGADIQSMKERAFMEAARKGNYTTLRYILALGVDPKLDLRQAPEEVREWIAQYINSSTLNDKLQNSLAEKPDRASFNEGKL